MQTDTIPNRWLDRKENDRLERGMDNCTDCRYTDERESPPAPEMMPEFTESEIAAMLPLTHLTHHIMLTVRREPLHGYAISKAVADLSHGRLAPGTGTFYSALRRMMDEGVLQEVDQPEGVDGNDSRRRFYALTEFGKAVLQSERERLRALLTLDGPHAATAG